MGMSPTRDPNYCPYCAEPVENPTYMMAFGKCENDDCDAEGFWIDGGPTECL